MLEELLILLLRFYELIKQGGFSIPLLTKNDEKQKALFLQFNRCGGCHLCIEVCPKKVLEKSDTLNTKVQYPPKFKEGVDCTFCQTCELVCPDFAIYVIPTEELIEKT